MNNRKRSGKLEKKARDTINSGALWFDKGDIETNTHLIEHKYTDKESYALNLETFFKIRREAYDKDKIPVMILEFTNPDNSCRLKLKIEEIL